MPLPSSAGAESSAYSGIRGGAPPAFQAWLDEQNQKVDLYQLLDTLTLN